MSFIKTIFEKVRDHPKRIVFPEGTHEQIIRAAIEYHVRGLGIAILLGSRQAIEKVAHGAKLDLSRVRILDPAKADDLERFAEIFLELRHEKGLGKDEAIETIKKQPIYFATMMLHQTSVDGLVAGVQTSVAATLRALSQTIYLEPGIKAASSCSVIQFDDKQVGEEGVLYFADCNVIPDPSADQLADIAVVTAKLARQLHGTKPRVAFLSYSTKRTSRNKMLDKILAAIALARQIAEQKHVEAEFDGELQVDVALAPVIAKNRVSHSSVAGKANVLIFPDLNSGNISFKLVQQLAPCALYGPILNGLSKPASDLSYYNVSVNEIVGAAAIVALQSVEYRKLYPKGDVVVKERQVYHKLS